MSGVKSGSPSFIWVETRVSFGSSFEGDYIISREGREKVKSAFLFRGISVSAGALGVTRHDQIGFCDRGSSLLGRCQNRHRSCHLRGCVFLALSELRGGSLGCGEKRWVEEKWETVSACGGIKSESEESLSEKCK